MKKKQIMASSISKEEEEEEEDRISGLPDNILCHILSFSDNTEEVVRTSLVSKRWRYVWISVPTIIISDEYLQRAVYSPELKSRFMDFVDRVLRCNVVSCLRKLRLRVYCHEYYEGDDDKSRIREWIDAVIARSAEDFEFGFHVDQRIEFPPRFLTCNNNVMVLTLFAVLLDVPTPVSLRNLKTIRLYGVTLCNEVSMKNLLEGCPVLEELDIICQFFVNIETLFVKSSSLKKLTINNFFAEDDPVGIVVDATNLEVLNLTCDVAEKCELNSLSSSLIKANLDLCNLTSEPSSVLANVWGDNIVGVLNKMSNTKCMVLSAYSMHYLQHARLDNLPMFSYLTRMDLTMIGENGWQVLPYFLECSPILLSFALTFESLKFHAELHRHFRKPKCLMLCLQYVNLQNFRGCANGMKMVSYFLENAIVLKKMSIGRYYSCSKHVEIIEKLLMFPRSSSACQIAIE